MRLFETAIVGFTIIPLNFFRAFAHYVKERLFPQRQITLGVLCISCQIRTDTFFRTDWLKMRFPTLNPVYFGASANSILPRARHDRHLPITPRSLGHLPQHFLLC